MATRKAERPILFSASMVCALLAGRKSQTRRLLKLPNDKAESRRGPWEVSTVGGKGCFDSKGRSFPEVACIWHPRSGTTVIPAYAVGDLLWVKETFVVENTEPYHGQHDVPTDGRPVVLRGNNEHGHYALIPHYRASEPEPHIVRSVSEQGDDDDRTRWSSSMFMPRWASRLTLEVTAVKVERLQDISEVDAIAEGAPALVMDDEGKFYEDAAGTHRCGYAGLWNHINGINNGADWDANPWVVAVTFNVHKANIDEFLKQKVAA